MGWSVNGVKTECSRFGMTGLAIVALSLGARPALWAQGKRPAVQPPTALVTVQEDRFFWKFVSGAPGPHYLVWSAGGALYGQSFDASGRALWKTNGVLLVPAPESSATWDAFADGEGHLVLTWINKGRVRVQVFGGVGSPQWAANQTIVSVLSDEATAVVGAGDSKGLYVVWSVEKGDAAILWAQRLDMKGARLWNPKGVEVAPGETDQRRPAAERDGKGGLLVAWKGYRDQISRIRIQRIDALGSRLWGTLGVNVVSPAGELNQKPLFTSLGDGGALIAWTQGYDVQNQVFVQKVDAAGARVWKPEGEPLLVTPAQKWNPVLAGDAEGGAWIGWENLFEDQGSVVLATKLNAGSKVFSGGVVALTELTSVNQARLFLSPDGAHGVWAVWIDNRSPGTGLYLQHVDALGRRLLGPVGQTIAERLKNPQRPQLVEIAPNRVAIAWAGEVAPKTWALYYLPITTQSVQP